MIGKEFLSAGKAVFTVSVPEAWAREKGAKPHYTYAINRWQGRSGAEMFFVNCGAEYGSPKLGLYSPASGELRLTRGSRFPADSWEYKILRGVLRAIHERRENDILAAGWNVLHAGKCGKCRRELTTPESISRGIGPECWKRMMA